MPTEEYFVKLEGGVKKVGYRTISVAAVKDPVMIEKIDSIVQSVKDRVKNNFESYGITDFFLDFKIYGKNGVMGLFPPGADNRVAHELAIVIEAVAPPTQDQQIPFVGLHAVQCYTSDMKGVFPPPETWHSLSPRQIVKWAKFMSSTFTI